MSQERETQRGCTKLFAERLGRVSFLWYAVLREEMVYTACIGYAHDGIAKNTNALNGL